MSVPAGARLGPYEIRGLLGAGGMGEVYRAWDARLGREVALKVLPPPPRPTPIAGAASSRRRRRREPSTTRTSLAVYDVGSHEGAPYIVSERLEGETLRERLGARRPHAAQGRRARGAGRAGPRCRARAGDRPPGPQARERVRVPRRDGEDPRLRPGQAARGGARAGPRTRPPPRLTRPGTIVGTVAYMSPEQVRGLAVDARSDIFSLGVVLYEMLARRRPFEGETPAEVQTAILRESPGTLPAIDGRVPAALDRVVRRCLEKRPEDRFDTARDLALSLEAVAGATGESTAAAGPARTPTAARDGRGPDGGAPRRRRARGAARLAPASATAPAVLHAAHVPPRHHRCAPASPRTATRSSTRPRGTASRPASSRPAPAAASRATWASRESCSRSPRMARWPSRSAAVSGRLTVRHAGHGLSLGRRPPGGPRRRPGRRLGRRGTGARGHPRRRRADAPRVPDRARAVPAGRRPHPAPHAALRQHRGLRAGAGRGGEAVHRFHRGPEGGANDSLAGLGGLGSPGLVVEPAERSSSPATPGASTRFRP